MSQVSLPLEQIKEILRMGDLVALPTETVYGLAADALNPNALQKVFEVKGRPLIDPLIIHVHDIEQVRELANLSPEALKLAEAFWPGALTLVMKKNPVVPDLATAGLSTVAIRMPKHPIMRKVLEFCQFPLAAPSANPFGYISPTEADHVRKTLGNRLKLIVDGGPCPIGIESTILDMTDPKAPKILRPGPISQKELEDVLNIAISLVAAREEVQKAQIAPGLLKQHYSPATPLFFLDQEKASETLAVIHLKRPKSPQTNDFWLSETGDLNEAAHNLFSLLQRLDQKGLEVIYIEKPPKAGIGIALCDRLSRAVHQ